MFVFRFLWVSVCATLIFSERTFHFYVFGSTSSFKCWAKDHSYGRHWVAVFVVTSLVGGLVGTYWLLPVVRRACSSCRCQSSSLVGSPRQDWNRRWIFPFVGYLVSTFHFSSYRRCGKLPLRIIVFICCRTRFFCVLLLCTNYALHVELACVYCWTLISFKLIWNCITPVEFVSYCSCSVKWSW
jgi:hypothetical protein